ncbi:hypothetical protein B9Z19DRAFT_1098798 [Tuber borchii]|uniref:Uncharacterized protein n=1 Tax=Tuber borchii TaxID=42251 RepID=A0A2T7A5R5_TUBBO|nr:hypothetical protein B9Z19DRAFT_1098798 [Tuber borchii]
MCTILAEIPISSHHEFGSGSDMAANSGVIVSPQRGMASKQSVFKNNIALQTELGQIQDERALGLQISDFRRSGAEGDFYSENIDVRGQTQYRRLRKRKGETGSVSPKSTTIESSEENSYSRVVALRKGPVPKRTYQELRCPSKREGGRKSGGNDDSSNAQRSSLKDQDLPL